MRSNLLLACILAVVHYTSAAQDTLTAGNIESWQPTWRFASGSDSSWSNPGFDDSEWDVLETSSFDPGLVDSTGWSGYGWFRTTFAVDSSLAGRPVSYAISLGGAATIFLDGSAIAQAGTPSSNASQEEAVRRTKIAPKHGYIGTLTPGRHDLAVKVSNFVLSNEGETRFGFKMAFDETSALGARLASRSQWHASRQFFLTGILGALALVYLLVFAFQPRQVRNGLFGLLAGLTMVIVFADLHSRTASDPSAYLSWRRIMELSAVVGWVIATRLVRMSFFKEPWRLFYPLLVLAGLVGLHIYFDPVGGLWSLSIFSVLAGVELLRRVGLAVFLSRPGAWVVALGAIFFIVTALHDYIVHLGLIGPVAGLTDLIHVGITGFVLLFAVFVGTEFTRENRTLELRVIQAKQEGDKALQEEKVNQSLRIDRIQAEFDKRRKEFEQQKSKEVDDVRRSLAVAQEHLKEMRTRLMGVEETASLGKLATGLAHEIHEVLNGVENLSEISKDLVQDLEQTGSSKQTGDMIRPLRQNLQRIYEQSALARSITDDILQHGASASDEAEPTHINALIERYLNLSLHAANGEYPDLSLEVERALDERAGEVSVPRIRLGRALLGVFRNAIDSLAAYVAESDGDFQPTLTVSSQRLDNAVLVRVRDNGPGVPQDLRDKIFDPFFSTRPDQSGLGLAIAHRTIVDDLDGTFGLEHFKEQGAGFYITIPFSKTGPENPPESE